MAFLERLGGLLGPAGLSPEDQRRLGQLSLLNAGLAVLSGRGPQAIGQGLLYGAQLGAAVGPQMLAEARDRALRESNQTLLRELTREPRPSRLDASGRPIPGTEVPGLLDVETGQPLLSERDQRLQAVIGAMDPGRVHDFLAGQALQRLFPSAPTLERVDLGDRIGVMRTDTGEIVRELPKGATPDAVLRERGELFRHERPSGSAVLSAETTRRGQDIDAQLAREKIAAEQARQQMSDQRARENMAQQVSNTLDAVNRAMELTDWRTAGGVGRATREMPFLRGAGTDALSLARTIDTIKANLSFQELQRMREASKTGGALGAITERELDLLGATVANLDPDMDPAELRANLERVQRYLKKIAEPQELIEQQQSDAPSDIDALMQKYGVQ